MTLSLLAVAEVCDLEFFEDRPCRLLRALTLTARLCLYLRYNIINPTSDIINQIVGAHVLQTLVPHAETRLS